MPLLEYLLHTKHLSNRDAWRGGTVPQTIFMQDRAPLRRDLGTMPANIKRRAETNRQRMGSMNVTNLKVFQCLHEDFS